MTFSHVWAGVGELIHSAQQPEDKRERAGKRQRCLALAVRNRLKVINLQNFSSLLQAFRHYDKVHVDSQIRDWDDSVYGPTSGLKQKKFIKAPHKCE